MSITEEIISGGVSKKTHGGKIIAFPRPRGETLTKIIYGDRVDTNIRQKISNWRTFINIYWNKDGTIEKNFFSTMKKIMGEVFNLDFTMKQEEVLYTMKEIFFMPSEKIISGIGMSYNLHEIIVLVFRSMFMIWKDHLEELVLKFDNARTEYIKLHKLHLPINNVKDLLRNWKHYNKYYKINSSSKLLLFSNLPEHPGNVIGNDFKKPKKWNSRIKQFHWEVSGVGSTVKLHKKLKEFVYIGYCPYKPIYRFNKLLEFPIKELVKATKDLGGLIKVDYCSMLSKINKVKIPNKFNVKTPKIHIKKIPSDNELKKIYSMSSSEKFDINNLRIRWYVDEYINLCKHTKAYHKKKEEYYIKLAEEISAIGNILTKQFYRRYEV